MIASPQNEGQEEDQEEQSKSINPGKDGNDNDNNNSSSHQHDIDVGDSSATADNSPDDIPESSATMKDEHQQNDHAIPCVLNTLRTFEDLAGGYFGQENLRGSKGAAEYATETGTKLWSRSL